MIFVISIMCYKICICAALLNTLSQEDPEIDSGNEHQLITPLSTHTSL